MLVAAIRVAAFQALAAQRHTVCPALARVVPAKGTPSDVHRSAVLVLATCASQAADGAAEGGAKKLWGGRFTGKTDPLMEKFNESLPFDKRMWAQDIRVRPPSGLQGLGFMACSLLR